jgi:SAM-dependent methyltransferase
MLEHRLLPRDVLAGYDRVSDLYPAVPPITLWRAWEYAAYKHLTLTEPVLDLGCGDGRFFKLCWPGVHDAVGLESDAATAGLARDSRVYNEVVEVEAHRMEFPPGMFASVFANCSLEHMNHPTQVLDRARSVLCDDGLFVASVVTDRLMKWDWLPELANIIGDRQAERRMREDYRSYHHYVSTLSLSEWCALIANSGFDVIEYFPILTERCSVVFAFMDHLWHLQRGDTELGADLHEYLLAMRGTDQLVRKILEFTLENENDWSSSSGLVIVARAANR